MDYEKLATGIDQLGESPVWSARDGALYWVDIDDGELHRYRPETRESGTWCFEEEVGGVLPRSAGGVLLLMRNGMASFDPETGAFTHLGDPEPHLPENRFNDVGADLRGRVWAGTMGPSGGPPQGTLYRIDAPGQFFPYKGGFYTTNGLAFSPDGQTMYFSDSNARVRSIWCCDYDVETGEARNERLFVDTHGMAGRPDGGACDAEGFYWMAGIFGGELVRFAPNGRRDRTITLPVPSVTKLAFGGPHLDVIYVTSLRKEGLAEDPDYPPGSLLAIYDAGVRGTPVTPCAF